MTNSRIEIVVTHNCVLGEGPVWDMKQERIIWVDILRGYIHEYFIKTKQFKTFDTGRLIGSVAVCKKGGLIAALQTGFAIIDTEKMQVESINDPEAHLPNNRFNEGKCDPAGRFWAGTMSLSEAKSRECLCS